MEQIEISPHFQIWLFLISLNTTEEWVSASSAEEKFGEKYGRLCLKETQPHCCNPASKHEPAHIWLHSDAPSSPISEKNSFASQN